MPIPGLGRITLSDIKPSINAQNRYRLERIGKTGEWASHNLINGERNADGMNENYSANYGHEGPTSDITINTIRLKQIKNMAALLFLSQGVPMILAGDEFGRTQRGNNNGYCQDNEISWVIGN